MLDRMHEEASQAAPRGLRLRGQPAADTSRHQRRRRAALRHEAAVVAAEIRRMRRVGRPEPTESTTPRMAT